jgi:hypothetical protein
LSPRKWHFQSNAKINQVVLATARLPEDVSIQQGQFVWQTSQIDFAGIDARMGKSSITALSGNAVWKKRPTLRLRADAASLDSEDLSALVFADKKLTRTLAPILPLTGKLDFANAKYAGPFPGVSKRRPEFSAAVNRITLDSEGLPGTFQVDRGQLAWRQNQLVLNDIEAKLGRSQISRFSATLSLKRQKTFHLSCRSATLFPGEIYPLLTSFEDLKPAVNMLTASGGTLALSGVDIKGPINSPDQWQLSLIASAQGMVVNSEALKDPLTVNTGTMLVSTKSSRDSTRNIAELKKVDLSWGDHHLILTGMLDLTAREIVTKMSVEADSLEWDQINTVLNYIAKKEKRAARRKDSGRILGTMKVKLARFQLLSHTVRQIESDIAFQPDKVIVTVNRADVCGISMRGLLKFTNQTLDLFFVPTAVDGKLVSTLSCLTAKKDLATGTYQLNGEILARAKPEAVSRALSGELTFSAAEGRIYRFGLLAKLLSILNVTEIYRGEIPDLTGEGFAYHGMTAKAKLQGAKITMEECSIDGVAMGIACEGDIDLVEQQIDLLILVAPFKTVDRIVEILPLIGKVLGGKLISIPFRAKGDLDDPDVIPLPPTAVGTGILGILERTLKLPITIIQPVISSMKGGEPDTSGIPDEPPR